jgi:hypothetical protein
MVLPTTTASVPHRVLLLLALLLSSPTPASAASGRGSAGGSGRGSPRSDASPPLTLTLFVWGLGDDSTARTDPDVLCEPHADADPSRYRCGKMFECAAARAHTARTYTHAFITTLLAALVP